MKEHLVEFLVREFQHMALTISKDEFYKAQGMLNRCDIESNALSALVSASHSWIDYCSTNSYDPTNLVHFAKYASLRIRGSITDESRKNTFASRWNISDYQQARRVGLDKPIDEISQLTGINKTRIKKAIAAIETDRSMRMSHDIPEQEVVICDETIGLVVHRVIQAITEMSYEHQVVLALKYFKELTLREIAQKLNLKQHHVTILHNEAILRVREVAMKELI